MSLLRFLTQHHYSVIPMELCLLAALFFSLKYYIRFTELRIFAYYLFFNLVDDAIQYVDYAMLGPGRYSKMNAAYSHLSVLIEIYALTYFIFQHVHSVIRRRVIKVSALVLVLLSIYTWVRYPFTLLEPGDTGLLGAFLQVICCILYFHEFFARVHHVDFTKHPAFLAITGIFVFSSIRVPQLLTGGLLGKYDFLAYYLNYLIYCILYLFILQAYLVSYRMGPNKR